MNTTLWMRVAKYSTLGALAGYVLVSPALMVLSDRIHDSLNQHELQLMRNSTIVGITETFRINFLGWSLTFSVLTSIVAGVATYFSTKAYLTEKQLIVEQYERFQRLINENNIGLFMTSLNGQIITANESLLFHLGHVNLNNLQQKLFSDLFSDVVEGNRFWDLMRSKSCMIDHEVTLKKLDGTNATFNCSAKLSGDKIIGNLMPKSLVLKNDFISVCMFCDRAKEISKTAYEWLKLSQFIAMHQSENPLVQFKFSHGICPDCTAKFYGKL